MLFRVIHVHFLSTRFAIHKESTIALFRFSLSERKSYMTIESFCKSTWNLSYSKVISMISKTEYIQFSIPKKNGIRTITSLPQTSHLYILQKNLNKYFLEKQKLPVCAKGFIKGENYISYLEPHIGAKYYLRIDIQNFFPTITKESIKNEFSNFISFETDDDKEKILDLISDVTTFKGTLPQGIPSSPMISNIIMARIDQRILKYCQALGISYTRYADDMLFSSLYFDFKNKKWFLKKIKYILASQNFIVNYSKLKYGENEISLNGYVISNRGIRLSRKRLWDIRKVLTFSQENYQIFKENPKMFLQKANSIMLKHRDLKIYPFRTVFQFTQFLCGYRSYLISFLGYEIDPQFNKKIKKLLSNLEKQLMLY